MYGLPHDFDATLFVGRTVESVTFTVNTIHVRFDGGCAITLEGSFVHQAERDEQAVTPTAIPVRSSMLMRIAGLTVASAWVERPGTLVLESPDGQRLCCLDDSEAYECYHVICDGREVVV